MTTALWLVAGGFVLAITHSITRPREINNTAARVCFALALIATFAAAIIVTVAALGGVR